MPDSPFPPRGTLFLTAFVFIFLSLSPPANAAGVRGYSSGVGAPRIPYASSTVISHGRAGFSIYNRHGVTRVVGDLPASAVVHLPDGRTATLSGDGRGGAWLLGAPGNHWIPGSNERSAHELRLMPYDDR